MQDPFRLLEGHEQVVIGNDEEMGLRCIIAIHSTALGPALGGTRFQADPSADDAYIDALRLARAMTYKAAAAGLDLGGGKAVILGNPDTDKTEALLRAYGRMVQSLNGRYVTACDVGTYPRDMSLVARETAWATGAEVAEGGSGDSGVLTALGAYVGMKACADLAWNDESLSGRHIAIQGVGKVGRRLAEHVSAEGAKVTVADVDEGAVAWCAERFGADIVGVDDITAVDADIFSPNALGGVINDVTLQDMTCLVVAGAANNQLAEPRHGAALADAGILYAPDYVINAGGLIQVADELHPDGFSLQRATARTEAIGERLRQIIAIARERGVPTAEAADDFAARRLQEVGRLRRFWLP